MSHLTYYSLSHKSLNTVPYTGSTFIVGAGPCARPLFPLMREMARHQINGPNALWHSPGPRPTNDL